MGAGGCASGPGAAAVCVCLPACHSLTAWPAGRTGQPAVPGAAWGTGQGPFRGLQCHSSAALLGVPPGGLPAARHAPLAAAGGGATCPPTSHCGAAMPRIAACMPGARKAEVSTPRCASWKAARMQLMACTLHGKAARMQLVACTLRRSGAAGAPGHAARGLGASREAAIGTAASERGHRAAHAGRGCACSAGARGARGRWGTEGICPAAGSASQAPCQQAPTYPPGSCELSLPGCREATPWTGSQAGRNGQPPRTLCPPPTLITLGDHTACTQHLRTASRGLTAARIPRPPWSPLPAAPPCRAAAAPSGCWSAQSRKWLPRQRAGPLQQEGTREGLEILTHACSQQHPSGMRKAARRVSGHAIRQAGSLHRAGM